MSDVELDFANVVLTITRNKPEKLNPNALAGHKEGVAAFMENRAAKIQGR